MRHRSKTAKLKRNASHRKALLSNLACSLIEHGRIKTTLGKAKALRPVAEKLVTLAKRDDLHSRRLATSYLHQKEMVAKLFSEVAPASKERQGGYCRITKLGPRMSDAAPMAYIEWVDRPALDAEEDLLAEVAEEKPSKKQAKAPAKQEAPAEEPAAEAEVEVQAEAEAEEAPGEAEEPAEQEKKD
jgi:large subunit ribosomal protein L17